MTRAELQQQVARAEDYREAVAAVMAATHGGRPAWERSLDRPRKFVRSGAFLRAEDYEIPEPTC